LTLWTAALAAAGAELSAPDSQIKAAYLYKFAKLTTWPSNAFASATAPIVIGVLGPDTLGEALDNAVKGKAIGKRPVTVVRFPNAETAESCHVLFVSCAEPERCAEAMARFEGRPILIVTDNRRCACQNMMIRLRRVGDHLRFEASHEAARKAGLRLSSNLLRHAWQESQQGKEE
jgi:hypothetical protein